VSKFMILHYGFEKPSVEDMAGWKAWFEMVAERQVDRAHMPNGNEITKSGIKGLPFGPESITGFTLITAENLEEATDIAAKCPVVLSTRVYELK